MHYYCFSELLRVQKKGESNIRLGKLQIDWSQEFEFTVLLGLNQPLLFLFPVHMAIKRKDQRMNQTEFISKIVTGYLTASVFLRKPYRYIS